MQKQNDNTPLVDTDSQPIQEQKTPNEAQTHEVIPYHAFGGRWKDAYCEIYGELPTQTWDKLSKTDKSKITSILNKYQAESERQMPAITQSYFASDTPDSFLNEWLQTGNLLTNLAIDSEMETLFKYNGKNWDMFEYKAYERLINQALKSLIPDGFNNSKVKSLADMSHKELQTLPMPKDGYLSFNNTVIEVSKSGEVVTHKHSKEFGLMATATYNYDQGAKDCPNFIKWLDHASVNKELEPCEEKRNTILAALYFVATNQYRWQFFIEIVGEGGSGKSIALHICKILAGGESNTVAIDLNALEGNSGKGAYANLIGRRLIVCPDQETVAGELAMTKRITGNDPISIPRMHKNDINLPLLPAVMVMTANQPLIATDRSSGVFRRRVSIFMNNVVAEADKDIELSEKLEMEAAAILNHVLNSFDTPKDAYQVLKKAVNNSDKMDAMLATEPLTQWIVECLTPTQGHREVIGSRMGVDQAKKGGQTNSAKQLLQEAEVALYPNYLVWCDTKGIGKPLSVVKFPDAVESKIKQLSSLGYIPVNKIKPYKKSTFENIQINQKSDFLNELRETVDNYCKFEPERDF